MSIFIIAEIGINHNGDLQICKDLVDAAVDSGCDAVKFQKRDIDSVYTKEFLDSPRESPWGKTQREQKLGLEFGKIQYTEIDQYCKKQGIAWFASAWDLKSQEFLQQFDCGFNKVASAMIVYEDLLKLIANEGKHTFISTGMSTYKDIQIAVDIFREANCPFELMHTISTYPMNDEDANLSLINTLKEKYQCNVGYSGHETGLAISNAAAAMRISSLERHITLDRSMYGSDQSASLSITGLKQLVGAVRKTEIALGDGVKTFSDAEKRVAENLRQHL
jgi:N-acetylneuraminate synthase